MMNDTKIRKVEAFLERNTKAEFYHFAWVKDNMYTAIFATQHDVKLLRERDIVYDIRVKSNGDTNIRVTFRCDKMLDVPAKLDYMMAVWPEMKETGAGRFGVVWCWRVTRPGVDGRKVVKEGFALLRRDAIQAADKAIEDRLSQAG
jgi:hypothetical protein